ncbi:Acyl-[acyl-carrier-protein]--UDP-N-acetylglucosamine O-acyltransferase [Rubripirellula lacrimiformis]|uniref:Acyl-[acyl-carrier-protein]--UDP-N-acetylglucosamine O-acyltransferase n=1 Tax=Rubripirellula lacrimiformis TaxID=1930273 RepID=A0A517N8Q8_9BACT|nr:Acyl-[acyl-carrier-protein]--UDP-N-acetylglucosamine O-acyltransferase [Rubripirellula lacrimiformis]
MPSPNSLPKNDTEAYRRWRAFIKPARAQTYSPTEILNLLGVTTETGHRLDSPTHASQTSYCFTEVPGSAVFAGNSKWLQMALSNSNVHLVFTDQQSVDALGITPDKPTIVSTKAGEWFHRLHNLAIHKHCYDSRDPSPFVSPSAKVDSTAIIRGPVFLDHNVEVGPYSIISGPTYIGPNTRIEELATLGTRGLFAKQIEGQLEAFEYYGGLTVGPNSHIHARANVAAAPHFQNCTTIGSDVSIGISSNVGHDCQIGNNCTIASTACICGRVVIGENSWIGAGSIVSEGCEISNNARIRIGSVVIGDVPSYGDVSGNFAIPHTANLKAYVKNNGHSQLKSKVQTKGK